MRLQSTSSKSLPSPSTALLRHLIRLTSTTAPHRLALLTEPSRHRPASLYACLCCLFGLPRHSLLCFYGTLTCFGLGTYPPDHNFRFALCLQQDEHISITKLTRLLNQQTVLAPQFGSSSLPIHDPGTTPLPTAQNRFTDTQ